MRETIYRIHAHNHGRKDDILILPVIENLQEFLAGMHNVEFEHFLRGSTSQLHSPTIPFASASTLRLFSSPPASPHTHHILLFQDQTCLQHPYHLSISSNGPNSYHIDTGRQYPKPRCRAE